MSDYLYKDTPFDNDGTTSLPAGLNLLTIISMVGNILNFFSTIINYLNSQSNYDQTKEMLDSGKLSDAPSFIQGIISYDMLEVMDKMNQQKVPIAIVGALGCLLCFYGAREMRRFKKQGYTLWLAGTILPILAVYFLVGIKAFTGINMILLGISGVFFLMYTMYRGQLR